MTEIDLLYAEDLSRQINAVEQLLLPHKWSGEQFNMRHSISESLKVYTLGRREVCFITDSTMEKISKMVWQELTDRLDEMKRDFEKL